MLSPSPPPPPPRPNPLRSTTRAPLLVGVHAHRATLIASFSCNPVHSSRLRGTFQGTRAYLPRQDRFRLKMGFRLKVDFKVDPWILYINTLKTAGNNSILIQLTGTDRNLFLTETKQGRRFLRDTSYLRG